MVTNFLFYLSEKRSFLKLWRTTFLGRGFLVEIFFFQHFECIALYPSAFEVSAEKYADRLMGVPLYVKLFLCCCFKESFLVFNFCNLILTCLSGFIWTRTFRFLWMYALDVCFFCLVRDVLSLYSLNKFFVPSYSVTPIRQTLVCLMFFYITLNLHFFHSFFF